MTNVRFNHDDTMLVTTGGGDRLVSKLSLAKTDQVFLSAKEYIEFLGRFSNIAGYLP